MSECKCTLRETAVGDGCRYCNPRFLIDHLADERDEQAVEIEQLQSRIKELEAVQLGLTKTLVEMEAENAELREESKKDLQTLSKAAWYLYTGQSARQVIDFIRCRLAFKTKQKADDEGKRDD